MCATILRRTERLLAVPAGRTRSPSSGSERRLARISRIPRGAIADWEEDPLLRGSGRRHACGTPDPRGAIANWVLYILHMPIVIFHAYRTRGRVRNTRVLFVYGVVPRIGMTWDVDSTSAGAVVVLLHTRVDSICSFWPLDVGERETHYRRSGVCMSGRGEWVLYGPRPRLLDQSLCRRV